MTGARRRFAVGTPDWGQTHLSLDAIVAFVDDELADGAHCRATEHLAHCPECAGEVIAQGQARATLRAAGDPCLPSSLLQSLRCIPQDADLPAPPAGLAMTADGQLVSLLGAPEPAPAVREPAAADRTGSTMQRRIRLGAGAAVSGLALGALAFGSPVPAAAPVTEQGVLGGPLLGVAPGRAIDQRTVDARLSLTPDVGSVVSVADVNARMTASFDRFPMSARLRGPR